MTWRRLGVMIRHLPPESATMTALRNNRPDDVRSDADPAEGRWSQQEMLLASAVDAINHQTWQYLVAHTPKGTPKPDKPAPIPRPGVVQQAKKRLTDEQYERLYAHINGLPGGPQLQLIQGGKDTPGG